jgi:hypothetical protein
MLFLKKKCDFFHFCFFHTSISPKAEMPYLHNHLKMIHCDGRYRYRPFAGTFPNLGNNHNT